MSSTPAISGQPVPPAYRLCRVPRVEIFADGIFRGRKYTEAEIDEMIANFDKFGPNGLNLLTPVVVIGHEENQEFLDRTDLPAAGIPSRVWREGPTMFADFDDVPEPVAALIAARAYRKVSIEHYNAERPFDAGNGQVFSDLILRRIALLGGEIPQVKVLADLPMPVFSYADLTVEIYRLPTGGACFAFSEGKNVKRDELIAKLKAMPKFATCFAEGAVDREALIARLKAALPSLDQGTIDSMTDEQLMGLALACAPPPEATKEGGGEMADYPDPATMIAELVAAGQDAAALEAMPIEELQAAYAALTGQQYRDKPKEPSVPVKSKTPAVDQAAAAKVYAEQQQTLARTRKLNAEMEAERNRLKKRLDDARKADVVAFCDRLVSEGRLLPAQRSIVEANLLKSDDVELSHSFSDNGQTVRVTSYEAMRRELSAWPVVMSMAEKLRTGGGAGDEARELSYVQRFAEVQGHALKAAGKKPQDYVHTFTEARKKDSSLTARKYGVPAEYCC